MTDSRDWKKRDGYRLKTRKVKKKRSLEDLEDQMKNSEGRSQKW